MTRDRPHPLVRLETVALVGIGGFAGSNLRYLVTDLFPAVPGVVLVNAVGSFLLGFLVYEARFSGLIDRKSRLLLSTGFLSSLTTYSTFAVATALELAPPGMIANVAANYGLGFAGVLLGRALARRVASSAPEVVA